MIRVPLSALLIALSVLVCQLALAEIVGDQQAGARKSQPCMSCHALDHFAQFSAEELGTAVEEIVAGESAHIPLPVNLTEQDIADIVAYLTAVSRPGD